MRRLIKSLLLAAVALFIGFLVAACGQGSGGVVASLSPSRSASLPRPSRSASVTPPSRSASVTPPSRSASVTPPSRSASISPPSPSASITPPSPSTSAAAQPSATQSAVAPAAAAPSTSSPAAGSGSTSPLIWLWIGLGALALIALIVGVVRASGRRSAAAAKWQSGVVNAYAESTALYDSMRAAETPSALAAADATAWWFDIQRRADDLMRTLYELRDAAPGEDEHARVSDVIASLQGARSAMEAERAPGGADGRSAQVVRSRLFAFEASIRALRAPDGRPA